MNHASYHFKKLHDADFIRLVETRKVRGATENIYEPTKAVLAWTEEWEELKPEVRQVILDSSMRGGIEALGSAIEAGTFEAHADSHLSWNTFEVDQQGWDQVSRILDRSLEDLLDVKDGCQSRGAEGPESILASFFMASFESPPSSKPFAHLDPAQYSSTPEDGPSSSEGERSDQAEENARLIAIAMAHPTRVRILMAMTAPRRLMSPKIFVAETGMGMTHVAYHFRFLAKTGFIRLVDTRQVRGANEHIYEACRSAIAWTDEWQLLGPVVQRIFLSSVMRGGVEALASAIQSGTFEARSNSHLSWDTFYADPKGWLKVAAILDRALSELMKLEKECAARIAVGAEPIVASFFMSSFESPKGIKPLRLGARPSSKSTPGNSNSRPG